MASVFIRDGRGEGHEKKEAETRVRQPQAKEHLESLKLKRQGRILSEPPKGAQSCQHLNSGLLASRL